MRQIEGLNRPIRWRPRLSQTVFAVLGIPMEIIIIVIIGIVLCISICICVCILGQTLANKRQHTNYQHQIQQHPNFNVDTMQSHPGYYLDDSHQRSSWMCAYVDKQPPKLPGSEASPNINQSAVRGTSNSMDSPRLQPTNSQQEFASNRSANTAIDPNEQSCPSNARRHRKTH